MSANVYLLFTYKYHPMFGKNYLFSMKILSKMFNASLKI